MSDDLDDDDKLSKSNPPSMSGQAAVKALVESAKRQTKPSGGNKSKPQTQRATAKDDIENGRRRPRPSTRDSLLKLVKDIEPWHTPGGEAFATLNVASHWENVPIRSPRFRNLMIARFYDVTASAPSAQATEDALRMLEAKALTKGLEFQVHLRIGKAENAIYLDLADDQWRAVKVTTDGWQMVSRPPVKFMRSTQMRTLPQPERGGSLNDLGDFINVKTDGDFKLIVTWLLATLRPEGPFPILLLNGEQGASKSTVSRVLRELFDPNAAPIRSAPREERDLAVSAWNAWGLIYDNLSSMPGWLSDAICRLATGGGFATRRLHSDREEVIFDSIRPICLNGIPDLASRPDLADRGIGLVLPAIPPDRRRLEREFWAAFEEARPFILGAMLDALVGALRILPSVEIKELPRMADFALFGVAVERALGWPERSFLTAYERNRAEAVYINVEASPLAQAVLDLVKDRADVWEGTATELLAELERHVSEKVVRSRAWPSTPNAIGSGLRRVATALRSIGVDVAMERVGSDRKRMIFIKKVQQI